MMLMSRDAAVLNTNWGVYYHEDRLHVLKADSSEEVYIPLGEIKSVTLALSDASHNLLAVAAGSDVKIYDPSSLGLLCTLPGSGRTVTALAWSPHQATLLAIGFVDGSVEFRDVRGQKRSCTGLRASHGACHGIIHSINDRSVLATLHRDKICVWNLSCRVGRPASAIQIKGANVVSLAWRPGSSSYLAATSGKEIRVYDVSQSTSTSRAASPGDSDDRDNYPERPGEARVIAALSVEHCSDQLQWINDNLVLAFDKDSRQATFLEFSDKQKWLSCLWKPELGSHTMAVQVQDVHGTLRLVGLNSDGLRSYDLPASILDLLQARAEAQDPPTEATGRSDDNLSRTLSKAAVGVAERRNAMRPTPIFSQRRTTSFARTSRQLQQTRRVSKISLAGETSSVSGKPQKLADPPSMTSSLELPKPNRDHDSPMPFLSPSIPARGSPQTVIGESVLELPPLPESFDASFTSPLGLGDDDDSDDEVDVLQGSATFLPGGINVPLPKACGALWAPNGHLLTFFPPKPRGAAPRHETVPPDKNERPALKRKVNRAAVLFPGFGTLTSESHSYSEESCTSVSGSSDEEFEDEMFFPEPQQPSSYHTQDSRLARMSPLEEARHKVKIVIHDVQAACIPCRTQLVLAENYQVLPEEEDSGSAVSHNNAAAAEANGLADHALVWRLIALLLDDRVPLGTIADIRGNDILVVARTATKPQTTAPSIAQPGDVDHTGLLGHIRWADSPFGSSWLVQRIFEWAESNADIQHLACFAAVLAEADRASDRNRAVRSFYERFPNSGPGYSQNISAAGTRARSRPPQVPVLRKRTPTDLRPVYESPTKLHHKLHTPSQPSSQPTTPYTDAVSTMPPFSFPALSRQASRLSASGSASPEAHRSSFSSAAKYYAQSITDKFASYGAYGTSPPMKKPSLSVSPSNNELSTSLPSGSWSKSVSFAASSTTASTARGSQLSTSFEERDQGSEDEYDSDKTVEDSLPHTPTSGTGDIFVTHKNYDLFSDEISGGAKAPLLTGDISRNAQVWVQHYSDQLRTWELLVKATEMEKMIPLSGPELEASKESAGVCPIFDDSVSGVALCAICATMLRSAEQICVSCLHTSHLSCLADYIDAIDAKNFTCPAGCGCDCTELEYVVTEPATPVAPATRPAFKKKLSFTDPRRWRGRMEDNSW